jgi:hypothetical protein
LTQSPDLVPAALAEFSTKVYEYLADLAAPRIRSKVGYAAGTQ